jgi:hypothetical protein
MKEVYAANKPVALASALNSSLRWRYLDLGWFFSDVGLIGSVHAANPNFWDFGGTFVLGVKTNITKNLSTSLEMHSPIWFAPTFTVRVTPLATLLYRF